MVQFATDFSPMAPGNQVFAGIEAGGTKFVCIVGRSGPEIDAEVRLNTTTPDDTLNAVVDFLRPFDARLAAIGIGSFGPVDLHPASPTWGYITSTPKPGWQNTNFAPRLRDALGLPVAFDTDVNAAAIGEATWGAARDVRDCLYITVGTGVGGGALIDGRPLHGLVHPEIGHIRVPRAPGDPFDGACPFHGDCLEGMVAGPALLARTGVRGEDLPDAHHAWTYVAHYLAHGIANLILTLSPQRIIIGGGVSQRTHLFAAVRSRVGEILSGYVRAPEILERLDAYVIPPKLGSRTGALGAMAMAMRVLHEERGA